MVPERLEDWTVEVISGLLAQGYYECEWFDFKERLPEDEKGRHRLVETCCAFANASGGFLVFGVVDKGSSIEERLKGLDPVDFPERFGNYPRQCVPSVVWTFRNPPIRLDSGRFIHVVHIPRSLRGPHACWYQGRENTWLFPKRTNKGTEYMSYEGIRWAFMGYYERRMMLRLLEAELEGLLEDARSMVMPDEEAEAKFSAVTFDLSVVGWVLGESFPLLAEEIPELVVLLQRIRKICGMVNNKVRVFHMQMGMPLTEKARLAREHNAWLRNNCEQAIALASEGLRLLRGIAGI